MRGHVVLLDNRGADPCKMRAMVLKHLLPPRFGASRMESLRGFVDAAAGLDAIERGRSPCSGHRPNFDDFWVDQPEFGNNSPDRAAISAGDAARLQDGVHASPASEEGRHNALTPGGLTQ